MKLGFSDIVLILIILGVVLIVFRGTPAQTNAELSLRARRPTAAEIEEERFKDARSSRMRNLGLIFVAIGLVVLAGALKMVDLIFSWYAAGALIIIAGVAVLFLSARR